MPLRGMIRRWSGVVLGEVVVGTAERKRRVGKEVEIEIVGKMVVGDDTSGTGQSMMMMMILEIWVGVDEMKLRIGLEWGWSRREGWG